VISLGVVPRSSPKPAVNGTLKNSRYSTNTYIQRPVLKTKLCSRTCKARAKMGRLRKVLQNVSQSKRPSLGTELYFTNRPQNFALAACGSSGIVSACHRGDWSYGSRDRIPPGYSVVAFFKKKSRTQKKYASRGRKVIKASS
jgi:hypothetical protein